MLWRHAIVAGVESCGGIDERCGAVARPSPHNSLHRRHIIPFAVAALALFTLPLTAQQPTTPQSIVPLPDSPPAKVHTDTLPDSLTHPPISPKRAFLTSLLVPGVAQSRLHRPTASMIFAAAEILSIGMARHAAQDLREARSAPKSIIVGYTPTDSTPIDSTVPTRFTPARIRARRIHYEDWIAALIFNHLISGIDAYVSANLWDFPANIAPKVSLSPVQKSVTVGANVAF